MSDLKLITNRIHKETGAHVQSVHRDSRGHYYAVVYTDGRRDNVRGKDFEETSRKLMQYFNEWTREPEDGEVQA